MTVKPDLFPLGADRKHLSQAWNQICDEKSDRTVAIMAAVLLDSALEKVLRSNLIKGSATNNLLDWSGGVGTTSQRINLARAMKLIGPRTRTDLIHVNKIRNLFAHDLVADEGTDDIIEMKFATPDIAKRIMSFEFVAKPKNPPGGMRSLFLWEVRILLVGLNRIIDGVASGLD